MTINEFDKIGMRDLICHVNYTDNNDGEKRCFPWERKHSFITGCAIGAMCAPAAKYAFRIMHTAFRTLNYGYGPPGKFFILLGLALFPPAYLVIHYALKCREIKDKCWDRIIHADELDDDDPQKGKEE